MGTLQAPTDEASPENDDQSIETSEKVEQTEEVHRFEGKVTPEQELSASVARKRRNISRKRTESTHRPRDVTPARELLSDKPITDEEDQPITPERKLKKTNSNNKTNETGKPPTGNKPKQNGENKETKTEPEKNNEEEKEKPVEPQEKEEITKLGKEEMNSDLQSLMSKAKRSASNAPREKPARMKRDSKLLMKKRSQSTPRPSTEESGTKDDMEEKKIRLKREKEKELQASEDKKTEENKTVKKKELVADFKQAQILSADQPEDYSQDFVSSSESSGDSNGTEEKLKHRKTQYAPAAQQYLDRKRLEKRLSQGEEPKPEKPKKAPRMTFKELKGHWRKFKIDHDEECGRIKSLRNRCLNDMGLLMIFCGLGGLIFKFTEGAFENFYKCGVKRVKRDFIDILWRGSHNLREEDWKTLARTKLRDFEEQLHTAHEAGVQSYSGQRSWSFLNGIVYALTIVTTIGKFRN